MQARRTDFGDSPELSARLLDLIVQGRKTATCAALRDYQAEGESVPQPGDLMVAHDWDDRPALIYQITDVQLLPFRDIPADFALAEGEGNAPEWRAAHQDFFERNGGFDDDMLIVCEWFKLVKVLM
ncbi:ASCH domain-containing protein [Paracoccus sp. (in: a-proteobacteria)]|uniref:ASCH domain-containing protein n=1 Tax=Paracoccus sp. TaxID=267 RepID=UPI0026DFA9C1|nr:ASCH domain-containing protein [Paracoccus sp. (in: a-proteobacteria)]MDO5646440.1 ASCH domain-containing protein [Paracoccus sp. (in: a-proteobacteria)]